MIARIDEAKDNDTLGGVIEVVVYGASQRRHLWSPIAA